MPRTINPTRAPACGRAPASSRRASGRIMTPASAVRDVIIAIRTTPSASGRAARESTGSPTIPRRSCAGRLRAWPAYRARDRRRSLVGLLAELGLTWSRDGQPLLPIGTLYDRFVNSAPEPWSFGLCGGAQPILVGTSSGVTLSPEAARTSRSSPHRWASSSRAACLGARLRPRPRVDARALGWNVQSVEPGMLGTTAIRRPSRSITARSTGPTLPAFWPT